MKGLHDGTKNRFTKIAMTNVSQYYFFEERAKARIGKVPFYNIATDKQTYEDVAEMAYRYFNKNPVGYTFDNWLKRYVRDVGRLFKTYGIPSQFPFSHAFKIYEQHNVNGKVFDYCCGWGNRLLAAMCNDLDYTGVDTNPGLVQKLGEMAVDFNKVNNLNLNVDVRCQCSEEHNPEWDNKFGLCFSSPPYFDLEKYNGENTSTTKFPEYRQWLEGYLRPTICNCRDYLIPGGRLIMSIKNMGKRKMYDEAMQMCLDSGMELIGEQHLPVVRRTGSQVQKAGGMDASNEKMLVFMKPKTEGNDNDG